MLSQEHGDDGQLAPFLLSQEEAAEFPALAPSTLSSGRVEGRGPKFIRISGRAIRYRQSDLEIFIAEREVRLAQCVEPSATGGGVGQRDEHVHLGNGLEQRQVASAEQHHAPGVEQRHTANVEGGENAHVNRVGNARVNDSENGHVNEAENAHGDDSRDDATSLRESRGNS